MWWVGASCSRQILNKSRFWCCAKHTLRGVGCKWPPRHYIHDAAIEVHDTTLDHSDSKQQYESNWLLLYLLLQSSMNKAGAVHHNQIWDVNGWYMILHRMNPPAAFIQGFACFGVCMAPMPLIATYTLFVMAPKDRDLASSLPCDAS